MKVHRVQIQQGGRELTVMVGRKRKQGKRYACGKLDNREPKSAAEIEMARMAVAKTMPHRRDLPPGKQHLPEAEGWLGRLSIINVISGLQYEAGKEYHRRVTRYRMAIQSPRSSAHTSAMDGRVGASVKPFVDDDVFVRIKAEYDVGFEALNVLGRRVLNAVNAAAIKDEKLEPGEYVTLRIGLDKLIWAYRLAPSGKVAAR